MISLATFTSPLSDCGYLPDRQWQLQYEVVGELSPGEYQERLEAGWRRFGFMLFRPACPECRMCRSLRVPAAAFRPDRSQRRAWKASQADLRIEIGEPAVTIENLELYDRFHAYQSDTKAWPERGPKSPLDYIESFVHNPFPTEEWRYSLGDRLVGVGYVDRLAGGLSAIYFFHDPDELHRSLGTFNVLSVIREAQRSDLPYVYLGYHVEGCRSLEYKGRFRPNEILGLDGEWRAFAT
jgi:arginine-tRNA-protein transferase